MSFRRLILQSGLFSITLHLAIIAMLITSFDFIPAPRINLTPPGENIVKAVAVNNDQVEKELQRIKDLENEKLKKEQALEKKLKDLESRTAKAEKQRREEEKRLAETKKKQAQEKQQREQEQQKLARLKKEQEELARNRRLEKERKEAEEAERIHKEEERKRVEEEQRRRQQEEEARQRQLADEKRQQEARQASQDQQMLRTIATNIYRQVVSNFNKSGLPSGLECELTVRTIPGGEVINVTISRTSGNEIFDRRAMSAVEKASPLPLPGDAATFDRLKLRQIAFSFRPED